MPLGGLTVKFVEEKVHEFGYKFSGRQDYVDKLNSLSQSLEIEAGKLITWTMMYAWYANKAKLNLDFLDDFEQCYKNDEKHAWMRWWEDFERKLEEEEAMLGIADDAEEQPPAMDYAAAVEDANHANRDVRPVDVIYQDGVGIVEVYYDDDEEPVVEDEIVFDEHEDGPEMSIRTRPTEEQIAQAEALREQDQSDPSPTCFSRACLVCATKNPRKRAVFTPCGHIICYPCAVENARSDATDGHCVFCRSTGGFVMLFEEEYGRNENNDDVIEDNEV